MSDFFALHTSIKSPKPISSKFWHVLLINFTYLSMERISTKFIHDKSDIICVYIRQLVTSWEGYRIPDTSDGRGAEFRAPALGGVQNS